MNRLPFRTRKKSTRETGEAPAPSTHPPPGTILKETTTETVPEPPPTLDDVLPSNNDFRTSLIFPHLARRFTLLRSASGELLSLDTMRAHLRLHQDASPHGSDAALTEQEEEDIIEALREARALEQQECGFAADDEQSPSAHARPARFGVSGRDAGYIRSVRKSNANRPSIVSGGTTRAEYGHGELEEVLVEGRRETVYGDSRSTTPSSTLSRSFTASQDPDQERRLSLALSHISSRIAASSPTPSSPDADSTATPRAGHSRNVSTLSRDPQTSHLRSASAVSEAGSFRTARGGAESRTEWRPDSRASVSSAGHTFESALEEPVLSVDEDEEDPEHLAWLHEDVPIEPPSRAVTASPTSSIRLPGYIPGQIRPISPAVSRSDSPALAPPPPNGRARAGSNASSTFSARYPVRSVTPREPAPFAPITDDDETPPPSALCYPPAPRSPVLSTHSHASSASSYAATTFTCAQPGAPYTRSPTSYSFANHLAPSPTLLSYTSTGMRQSSIISHHSSQRDPAWPDSPLLETSDPPTPTSPVASSRSLRASTIDHPAELLGPPSPVLAPFEHDPSPLLPAFEERPRRLSEAGSSYKDEWESDASPSEWDEGDAFSPETPEDVLAHYGGLGKEEVRVVMDALVRRRYEVEHNRSEHEHPEWASTSEHEHSVPDVASLRYPASDVSSRRFSEDAPALPSQPTFTPSLHSNLSISPARSQKSLPRPTETPPPPPTLLSPASATTLSSSRMPRLRPDSMLAQNIAQAAAAATSRLKDAPLTPRRKSGKRIKASAIGAPHLVSASQDLPNLPGLDLACQALERSGHEKDKGKLSWRFKKLTRSTVAKPEAGAEEALFGGEAPQQRSSSDIANSFKTPSSPPLRSPRAPPPPLNLAATTPPRTNAVAVGDMDGRTPSPAVSNAPSTSASVATFASATSPASTHNSNSIRSFFKFKRKGSGSVHDVAAALGQSGSTPTPQPTIRALSKECKAQPSRPKSPTVHGRPISPPLPVTQRPTSPLMATVFPRSPPPAQRPLQRPFSPDPTTSGRSSPLTVNGVVRNGSPSIFRPPPDDAFSPPTSPHSARPSLEDMRMFAEPRTLTYGAPAPSTVADKTRRRRSRSFSGAIETTGGSEAAGADPLRQLFAAASSLGLDQEELNRLVARSSTASSLAQSTLSRSRSASSQARSIGLRSSTGTSVSLAGSGSKRSAGPTSPGAAQLGFQPVPSVPESSEEHETYEDEHGAQSSQRVVRRTLIFPGPAPRPEEQAYAPSRSSSVRNIAASAASRAELDSGCDVNEPQDEDAAQTDHRRTASLMSVHDRVPTPPPSRRSRKFSSDLVSGLPAVPQVPEEVKAPGSGNLDLPALVAASRKSRVVSVTTSRTDGERGSSYSASLYDMYGGMDEEDLEPPAPSLSRHASGENLPVGQHLELLELADGRVLWNLVGGLRDAASADSISVRNRDSTASSVYSAWPGPQPPRRENEDAGSGVGDLQIRVRGHQRFNSKGSNASSIVSRLRFPLPTRRSLRIDPESRASTDVYYSNDQAVTSLLEELSRGVESENFNIQAYTPSPDPSVASGPPSFRRDSKASGLTSSSAGWTVEERLERVLQAVQDVGRRSSAALPPVSER